MRVVIAQCTDTKRDEPCPARRMYEPSDYFVKQAQYGERADEWWIQSAKYGLVHPDRVIDDYDLHATDLEYPDEWAREIACCLLRRYDPTEANIEILGGAAYADPLTPHLEQFGFEVHEPLRGLKIGERKAELKRRVRG